MPNATTKSGPATQATTVPDYDLTSLDGGLIWVVTWGGPSGTGTGGVVTGHSIADGVYTITLNNTLVTAGGTTMSSPQTTDKFYRLYGDVSGYEGGTGVARVTTTDSTPFGPAFLKTTGVVGYNAGFDFDGDGRITKSTWQFAPALP